MIQLLIKPSILVDDCWLINNKHPKISSADLSIINRLKSAGLADGLQIAMSRTNTNKIPLWAELFIASYMDIPPLHLCTFFDLSPMWDEISEKRNTMKIREAKKRKPVVNIITSSNIDELFQKEKGTVSMKTNLKASDVIAIYDRDDFKAARPILKMMCTYELDWNNAAAAGILLMLCLNPMRHMILKMFTDYTIGALQTLDAVEILKDIHNLIRKTMHYKDQAIHEKHLPLILYVQELFNRSNKYKYNAKDEIIMRQMYGTPKAVMRPVDGKWVRDVIAWKPAITQSINDVFNEMYVAPKNIMSFKQFWDRRLIYTAPGSAPGFKFKINDKFGNIMVIRPNKRLALEDLNIEELEDALRLIAPILHAKGAIKFETSKNRPLWNGNIKHYLICSYICEQFEKSLGHIADCTAYAGLIQALRTDIERIMSVAMADGIALFDFSDCNIDHTHSDMRLMWDKIVDLLIGSTDDKRTQFDLMVCGRYITRTISHVIMQDSMSAFAALVLRSLMTGSRGTAITNTSLNTAYCRIVIKTMRRVFGDIYKRSDHIGDDGEASFLNWLYAEAFTVLMNLSGHAGAKIKLLTTNCLIEYTRILYNKNGCRGCLNRSIASTVCGEFHNITMNDIYDRYSSCINQMSKLLNRGAFKAKIEKVLAKLAHNKCRLVMTTHGDKKVVISVNRIIAHTSQKWGGLGIPDINNELDEKHYILNFKRPIFKYSRSQLRQLRGTASNDLIKTLFQYDLTNKDIENAYLDNINDNISGSAPSEMVSDALYRLGMKYLENMSQVKICLKRNNEKTQDENDCFNVLRKIKELSNMTLPKLQELCNFDLQHNLDQAYNIRIDHGSLIELVTATPIMTWSAVARYFGKNSTLQDMKQGYDILITSCQEQQIEIANTIAEIFTRWGIFTGRKTNIQWLTGTATTRQYNMRNEKLSAVVARSIIKTLEDNFSATTHDVLCELYSYVYLDTYMHGHEYLGSLQLIY